MSCREWLSAFALCILVAAPFGAAAEAESVGRSIDLVGGVDARGLCGLVWLEAPTAPRGVAARFHLEADAFTVTVGRATRTDAGALPLMGSDAITTKDERVREAAFGRGIAVANVLREGAILAAYPLDGAAAPCRIETPEGVRADAAGPLTVTPTSTRWTSVPPAAFRHHVADEHVAFTPRSGALAMSGDFTLYVWDADVTVEDSAKRESFATGVERYAGLLTASVESWTWVRVAVTNGRLAIDTNVPAVARAASLDVETDAPALALAGGAPVRLTASGGALSATPILATAAAPAALAPAGPLDRAHSVLLLVAFAAVGAVGAGTIGVSRSRRRREPAVAAAPAASDLAMPREPGVDAFLLAGREAAGDGDSTLALKWFESALALEPGLTVGHVLRGLCLESMELYHEAHAAFVEAARLGNRDAEAHYHLARSLMWGGYNREAIDALAIACAAPGYVERAAEDASFVDLRDHPRFLALLGRL